MADTYDTILTVPGRDGLASVIVQLNLDVPEPDLSGVEALLEPDRLAGRMLISTKPSSASARATPVALWEHRRIASDETST